MADKWLSSHFEMRGLNEASHFPGIHTGKKLSYVLVLIVC